MVVCTASAPGKTIIHGEHAVVYGKAAVAASVDLRTRVNCSEHESLVVLEAADLDFVATWPISKFEVFSVPEEGYITTVIPSASLVPQICSSFEIDADSSSRADRSKLTFLFLYVGVALRHNNGCFAPAKFTVTSKLPLGAGLGSSASYSTALAAVVLARCRAVQRPLTSSDRELISAWAFQAECFLHGRPSGIDNTICTHGGALLFKGGKICDSLESMPGYRVLLVNTQVPRNTKALVAEVKRRHDQFPEIVKPVLESIEAISETFWKLLKSLKELAEGNIFPKVSELMQMNQSLLNCVGVGHPQLDRVAAVAASHGLTAKLTGGGGGGCALVLCHVGNGDALKKSGDDVMLRKLSDLGCVRLTIPVPRQMPPNNTPRALLSTDI